MNIQHIEHDITGNAICISKDLYDTISLFNQRHQKNINDLESRIYKQLDIVNNRLDSMQNSYMISQQNIHLSIHALSQQLNQLIQKVEQTNDKINCTDEKVDQNNQNTIQDVSRLQDLIQSLNCNVNEQHHKNVELFNKATEFVSGTFDLCQDQNTRITMLQNEIDRIKPTLVKYPTVGNLTSSSTVNMNVSDCSKQLTCNSQKNTNTLLKVDLQKTDTLKNIINLPNSSTNQLTKKAKKTP